MAQSLSLILCLFVLSTAITPISSAYACNGSCDELALIILGAPAVLITTFGAPLIGRAIDKRENPPFWPAVGLTFLTSSAGAFIAYARYDDSSAALVEAVALPVLFGSATTVLVYILWPRSNDSASTEFNQTVPQIAVVPTKDGGFIGFSWQF